MRLLTVLAFLAFSTCTAFAQDKDQNTFDFDVFNATAERAVEVIANGVASDDALDALRGQLAEFRSLALKEQEKYADRVATIEGRLKALGPAPEDGVTEGEDVANLRAELGTALNAAKAPIFAAEEARNRAVGLIREIDLLVRSRKTQELLRLGPTPLNPSYWGEALRATTSYFSLLSREIETNWQTETSSVQRIGNLPAVAIMAALGLLLLLRARRWARQLLEVLLPNATLQVSALFSFITSLAQLALPMVGIWLVLQSVDFLEVLGLRGQFLTQAIAFGGVLLYFASWLARSLMVPNGRQPALIDVDPPTESRMRRLILQLALAYSLNEVLRAINAGDELPEQVNSVLQFPLLVLGGWSLVLLGRKIITLARVSADKQDVRPLVNRVSILIGQISVAVGFSGPILAAIGYGQAGARLTFATIMSLALIAAFYIFFRLIGLLTGQAAQPVVAAGSSPEDHRSGALFQIALAFGFICLSIPLLALVWGARISDLQEVWLYLRDGISLGDTRISITDFLTFVLIFSLGYTITRLLQSALRSTVLPNTKLDSGGQNAIVTGTGYTGIFLASLAAISATGLDLSNLAIVAGALSVGIGFGLQAIVSNFVSGIILLIERPIKEGDWIEVGAYSGTVRKISVRSTMIQTFDRATLIIPNADLISGTVTNMTHKSLTGRVKIPIGVSYDSDPRQVESILRGIAEAHPMVLRDPAPSVVFMGFGADSLDFEIRAILRDVNWMLSAKSDMNYEIMRQFGEAGIEIPFAQRDIKLKNMDELAELLKDKTQV